MTDYANQMLRKLPDDALEALRAIVAAKGDDVSFIVAEQNRRKPPVGTRIAATRALANRVLCVAVMRIEGAWCAYVDAVPGVNHQVEALAVADNGDKLPEHIARAVFLSYRGHFEGVPYAY